MNTLLDALAEGIDGLSLSADLVEAAESVVASGCVARPRLSQRSAVADVADGRGHARARLRLARGEVAFECSCGRANACVHVAALAFLLSGRARRERQPVAMGGLEQERHRRVERGRSGLFRIDLGGYVYGVHGVRSPSGQEYRVTIRTLEAPHNSCTCQDFQVNRLGLCKHIAAVMDKLGRGPRGRARVERARRSGPPGSYLYVNVEREPRVGLELVGRPTTAAARFARRWFDGGELGVVPADSWPEILGDAERAGIEVPHEVRELSRRQVEASTSARRAAEIAAEIERAGEEQPGFRGRLYPYQVEGVAFLASQPRALLADDMGLGKTAQTIAVIARLLKRREIERALVVCPASLKHQWAQEVERFIDVAGAHPTVVRGGREARQALYRDPGPILVTSYELLRADERYVAALAPDLLILDEAQRIKNWRTRTSDVVKRIPTRRAIVLTGTPLENRLDDLYSLMQVVDPHLLGPLWRFNRDFALLDERGRPVGYRNLAELRARVRPRFLRRRKEDVLDQLPDRLTTRLEVSLDRVQREVHDESWETAARLLSILRRRPLSPVEEQRLMRAFQRMRMACDAGALVGGTKPGSPKLDELEHLLHEICVQGGHKVVVFSEWERMLGLAAEVAGRLRIQHVRLHGGVPSDNRGALVQRFREDPGCQVFFSTDAGGVGLNLQAADHVINLDLPWNPAVLAQRIARVHRLGQRRAVNVTLLLAENSIESRMEGTLAAKRALFEAAVGDSNEDTVTRGSLASRIATVMGETFAATTAPHTGLPGGPSDGHPPGSLDQIGQTARQLGDALERVVRLAGGSLAAIVADGAAMPAEASVMPLLPVSAAAALAVLGDASPLARAEVVYEKPTAASRAPAAWRTAALAAAARKSEAARVLRNAGQPSEALPLLHACLVLLCRAAAEDDPGEEPAALLAAVYGKLVPAGVLTTSDAHALSRAAELTRAFAASPVPAPDTLVEPLFSDVADLVTRVETRLTARAVEENAAVPLRSPEICRRDRVATERSAVGSAI